MGYGVIYTSLPAQCESDEYENFGTYNDLQVTIIDICSIDTVYFTNNILSSFSIDYYVYNEAIVEHLLWENISHFYNSESFAWLGCSEFSLTVSMADSSDIDDEIFYIDPEEATVVSPLDLTMAIETSDIKKVETYEFLMTVVSTEYENVNKTQAFEIIVSDPCKYTKLTIPSTIFTSTYIVYNFYTGPDNRVIDQSLIQSNVTTVCPNFTFSMINQNDKEIDSSLFLFTETDG